MQDVVVFKLVSIFWIWALGFAGGILPYFIQQTNQTLMSILNCFSAGVFLAGGFLHLLASAGSNPGLERWSTMDDGRYAFPYAEMFCSLGFLAVFYVEQWAHAIQEHMKARMSRSFPSKEYEDDNDDPLLQHTYHAPVMNGKNPTVAIVLFIALSFHSILEGLGIGAQSKSAWSIFMAIVVHKGLAAFALGSGFLRTGLDRNTFVATMFAFSCMSVLGILGGWIILADEDAEEAAASGICLALASGTFIYVAVMEVLPAEFAHTPGHDPTKQRKLLALGLGYAIFGIMAKWT